MRSCWKLATGDIDLLLAGLPEPAGAPIPLSEIASTGVLSVGFVLAFALSIHGALLIIAGMDLIPTCKKTVTIGFTVFIGGAVIWLGMMLVMGRWI